MNNRACLRRGVLYLAVCLTGFGSQATANDLSFPSLALGRESSAALELKFDPSPEPVVAFQFDLEYDTSAIQLNATVGDAARNAGKLLYSVPLTATKSRFVVFGWNQTPVLAGPLIRFLAATTSTAEARGYDLKFSNLTATFPNGATAPISSADGLVTVLAERGKPLSAEGVVNAASLTGGAVAGGEIATLFGAGIGPAFASVPAEAASSTLLAGISVWFDGKPAPLLYAGPNQINAIIPWAINGETTEIVVKKDGQPYANVSVPVRQAAPAIFALTQSGVGPAAILNSDSTVNSPTNPAKPGMAIALFATGSGPLEPSGTDGEIVAGDGQRTRLPVSVKIGGKNAEVFYAGSAPRLISGALQINCIIPSDVARGAAIDIILTIGGQVSPMGPTLSIQ